MNEASKLRQKAVLAETDGTKKMHVEPGAILDILTEHDRIVAEKSKTIRELLKEQSEFCQETATLRMMLGKQEAIITKLKTFDERAFTNQWVIRGVGMPLPQGAVQGARCYHSWFVAKALDANG